MSGSFLWHKTDSYGGIKNALFWGTTDTVTCMRSHLHTMPVYPMPIARNLSARNAIARHANCIQCQLHAMPNACNAIFKQCQLQAMPIASNANCKQCQLQAMPIAHNAYCTQCQLLTMPIAHNCNCTHCQLNTIPTAHNVSVRNANCTQYQLHTMSVYAMPIARNPERTQCRMKRILVEHAVFDSTHDCAHSCQYFVHDGYREMSLSSLESSVPVHDWSNCDFSSIVSVLRLEDFGVVSLLVHRTETK